MNNLSVSQLKQAIQIKEQIENLESQLHRILGGTTTTAPSTARPAPAAKSSPKKKSGISASGRARIVAAQKARWAKIKGKTVAATKSVKTIIKKKGEMSAAAKAKLSKMMKARWAERKKAGKTKLG